MITNAEGLRLLKTFENCKLQAYQDIKGIWTIGYGSTSGVTPGMSITQEQADDRLRNDLKSAEFAVQMAVHTPLNENQFSACVCLTYNIGGHAFHTSTLCRLLNEGKYESAADAFLDWCHANGQVVPGLLRRRQAERKLFLECV